MCFRQQNFRQQNWHYPVKMYKHVVCVSTVMESYLLSTQSRWYTGCPLRAIFPRSLYD